MLHATISADIIASSSLSAEEMKHLTANIYDIFKSLSKYQVDNNGKAFISRLVLGDMVECFVENPNDALRVALILKSGIKSFKLENPLSSVYTKESVRARRLFETYGVRIAIGIGEMDLALFESGIFNGSAINISGRLIAEQNTSNKERVTVTNTLFIGSVVNTHTQIFRPVLSLLDTLLGKMTLRQSEIVYKKLWGCSESEIAKELDITQSSVNQHSTAAGWNSIKEALKLFETFDFNAKFAS